MKKIILSTILIAAVTLTACGSNAKNGETKQQEVTTSGITTEEIATEKVAEAQNVQQAVPVYANMSYYIESKLDNYKAFSLIHPDYTLEDIVTYVNIGLDNPFYSNTKVIQNPDDILVLCNKYNSLPDGYEPSDLVEVTNGNSAVSGLKLRKEAAQAFDKLCAGAKQAGYTILGASGY